MDEKAEENAALREKTPPPAEPDEEWYNSRCYVEIFTNML